MILGSRSSGDFTSLDGNSFVITPGGAVVAGKESGSWSVLYVLEQQLWDDSRDRTRNLGLLSHWGYADSKTNPFEWAANVSLQANGLIESRKADSMGVAWFCSGLSSNFKDLLSPPLEIRDLTGVEVYYNAAITPRFHLTTDLQLVEPVERTGRSTALVLGLRAMIDL